MGFSERVGLKIVKVKPRSLAAKAGIQVSDYLLSVNGVRPRDFLDYRYLVTGEKVRLTIRRKHEIKKIIIRKRDDEDPGIIFATDCFEGINRCRNRCIFCFVDQLPPGLRASLYEKDDDYRLSFLHGNFITLTNLKPRQMLRILTFHLSPLYLSIHATEPVVRGAMLGNRGPAPVLDKIAALAGGGITMHVQVVLCPGINDGRVLARTITDLAKFWPSVASVGVVPVGLTKFRKSLPVLRSFTKPECVNLIKQISSYQREYGQKRGVVFVHLADEFYLRAGHLLPPGAWYDDFPQIENGIGPSRLFRDEFRRLAPDLPLRLSDPRRFVVGTAKGGAEALFPVMRRLNRIKKLHLRLMTIPSTFFGPRINVAGLLTGKDLLWGVRGLGADETLLLPRVLLRQGTSLLLDGMTIDQVANRLGCRIRVIAPTAGALVKAVLRG